MRDFMTRLLARRQGWGLLVLPVATPEVTVEVAPYALALVLLFSGIHMLMQRSFRVGSLVVGASLGLMVSAGILGR
jgi:hypothetical protein